MIENIHWLGHASFRIEAKAGTLYIDPWKLLRPVKADLILVTHEHFDHLSPDDISALLKQDTMVVCPASAAQGARSAAGAGRVKQIAPGEEMQVRGVKIRAIPAYNVEPERQGFHPRDRAKPRVGFFITVDGTTIYHTGDTDDVPEMEGLSPDILLIPVGGTYTMDARQAAGAAAKIRPGLAVPMHWGDIVGARKDAEEFKKLYKGNIKIMEKE